MIAERQSYDNNFSTTKALVDYKLNYLLHEIEGKTLKELMHECC